MKRWWAVFMGGLVVLLGVGGGCSYSALDTARRIFKTQYSSSNLSYKTFRWCTNGLPFVDRLGSILGGNYIVLLQNNTELRPSGGFAGSYAMVETSEKGIENIRVEDIYEPDGKLPGHVDPPYPIQEAFGQGWWKLRDANWDPDFASAAGAVRWFMRQGGEKNIKGVVAVNLELVKKLIEIYGPIKLATYDETITDKNLYQLAQQYAETRTEGNKTDKRGFLGAVGVALEEKIKSLEVIKSIKLIKLVFQELRKGEILMWMEDREIQNEIEYRKWGGRLEAGWNEGDEYLYIVESNLGANKANCCIDRDLKYEVGSSSSSARIEINWRNNNEFENPKPPVFWGGNYIDYVRVIIPKNKKVQSIRVGENDLRKATEKDFPGVNALRRGRSEDIFTVEPRGDLQIIGFWAVVEVKKDLRVRLQITSDDSLDRWLFKHQPGSGETNYQVVVDGVVKYKGRMDRDIILGP